MVINKYLPFAILFFFLNTTGLPHGLTYMTLLSPALYAWVVWNTKREPMLPFILSVLPFMVVHLINGVDLFTYFKSLLNLTAVYIFVWAFYVYAKKVTDWNGIMYSILLINFLLCIVALPLYYSPWKGLMWIEQYLTEGFSAFNRLRLFTYEASYYAVLFTPVLFYCCLQILLKLNRIPVWIILPMLLLPLVLSFSLGVIACILLCISLLLIVYARTLLRKKRVVNYLLITAFFLIMIFALTVIFFPENPLFIRIGNIFSGHDSSGKGRTSDAFMLVKEMISLKSEYWGIGFGQIKVLGEDIVRNYYHYDKNYAITIPNASAETLAVTGWIGWWLRLLVQLLLCVYTRVWNNYYRFVLFIFIFVYQFTGSFITSQIEYIIWVFAFVNIFPQFDLNRTPGNTAPVINSLKDE